MSRQWPNGSSTIPTVTAEFGVPHPVTGYHRGIDLIGWDIVRSADGGQVVFAGWNGTAGYEVKVRHHDGYATRYLHLDDVWAWSGQWLDVGAQLGPMGDTGEVTGLHLHFEVIAPDGETRVNPRSYIPAAPDPEPTVNEDKDEEMPPIAYIKADGDERIWAVYLTAGANNPHASLQGNVYCVRRQVTLGEYKLVVEKLGLYPLTIMRLDEIDDIPPAYGSN